MKTALITGITGQDGSFLAEELLAKDYKVVGLKRRSSIDNTGNISHGVKTNSNFILEEGDLTDRSSLEHLIYMYEPDEIYNVAAQSHVGTSFKQPDYTFQVNTVGLLNLLEIIRANYPATRILQASTSEMYGSNFSVDDNGIKYQNEHTPFHPRSPYAVSKVAAHHLIQHYREAHDIFATTSICFNHESERRGEFFVSRKITKWVAGFKKWLDIHNIFPTELDTSGDYICENQFASYHYPKLRLGNLDAKRDWGYARDYVCAMHKILTAATPQDYVVATGEARSVRDFLDEAFRYIGVADWSNFVVIDPKFYRPSDVEYLNGDSSRIREELGWYPKVSFSEMVYLMIKEDS